MSCDTRCSPHPLAYVCTFHANRTELVSPCGGQCVEAASQPGLKGCREWLSARLHHTAAPACSAAERRSAYRCIVGNSMQSSRWSGESPSAYPQLGQGHMHVLHDGTHKHTVALPRRSTPPFLVVTHNCCCRCQIFFVAAAARVGAAPAAASAAAAGATMCRESLPSQK
jgi:hypothetical protein